MVNDATTVTFLRYGALLAASITILRLPSRWHRWTA